MKIGIIDADLMDNGTKHPNLALMKIAGYYKNKGHQVNLIYKSYDEVSNYDEVYISKVFTFTGLPDWILTLDNIYIGGTGFFEDGGENLPYEIEHQMPFYDLYKEYIDEAIEKGKSRKYFSDYLDYSIGFTTRGCFRKCSFCVNKKYDSVQKHSPVDEFLDESRPYIYLWDDNILGYSNWLEVLEDLKRTDRQFQFRQGIDLRLLNDEKAKVLNSVKYQGDFIFAFDHLKDAKVITEKVQLWKRYSAKTCKMYVLCGYDSQDENDIESVFKRISILMKYGSIPYIMRYEDYKSSNFKGMYIQLARWCNQPQFFKKKSFREFCIANQGYKKDKSRNCSAYQTMLDFEESFPGIAEKYFDLKFEEENIYKIQYGYGRKYKNKSQCEYCKIMKINWDHLIEHNMNNKILKLYFTKEIDVLCIKYANSECKISDKDLATRIIKIIEKSSIEQILNCISESDSREEVSSDNIPQYSDLEDAFYKVTEIMSNFRDKSVTFEDLGYYLQIEDNPDKKQSSALKKYGENHAKLASLLDLIHISKNGVRSEIRITKLGMLFARLPTDKQEEIAHKLCLRIPIIQNRLIEDESIDTLNRDLSILAENTQKRRISGVTSMITSITIIRNI